jgi:hypothetical protein
MMQMRLQRFNKAILVLYTSDQIANFTRRNYHSERKYYEQIGDEVRYVSFKVRVDVTGGVLVRDFENEINQ